MTKIVDGKRIYGAWAGNPVGTPEDTTQCIEEVMEVGRGSHFYQCGKKRGYGEGGLYCKIHDPEYIKTKLQDREAIQEKEIAESLAKHKLEFTAVKACKAINPDNPQAVAESINDMHEALKEVEKDINWMLNNRQFLNPEVFDYIDKAIEKAEGK